MKAKIILTSLLLFVSFLYLRDHTRVMHYENELIEQIKWWQEINVRTTIQEAYRDSINVKLTAEYEILHNSTPEEVIARYYWGESFGGN